MTIVDSTAQSAIIAGNLIRESYGQEGELSRLPGENLNFLVTTASGTRYVAKIADETLPENVVAMEQAALEHAVQQGLALRLPIIIKNYDGKIETRIVLRMNGIERLRLIEYIEGDSLQNISDISEGLRTSVGRSVAALGQSLATFDHPAAHRSHRWDLTRADQHKGAMDLLRDPQQRALLEWAFEQWSSKAAAYFDRLPWQFIHGDLNPENILVENGRISGILDFGDCGFNPAVCDLAICLAYQMMEQADPLAVAAQVVAGYQSLRRLSPTEESVLLPLALGRLAVTISVATARRQLDADHPNWFVSEASAWRLLARLSALDDLQLPVSG